MPRFKSSHPEHQIYEDAVSLIGPAIHGIAAAENGIGTIEAVMPGDMRGVLAYAEVEPNSVVGDTFDLYIQTLFTCSGVPTWVDVIHFTQLLGNDAAVAMFDKIAISLDEGFFEIGTALAADAQRNLIGEKWRCRWDTVGVGPPDFDIIAVDLFPL